MNTNMAEFEGETVYDFDLNDFGNQPEYDKEFLNGKVLIIHGVSEAIFEGSFEKGARSLLHSWPSEPRNIAPWGALLSEDSPAIKQTQAMQDRGKVPFVARVVLKDSQAHKGQTYWTLEPYRLQYNSDGNLVDPNATQLPLSAASNSKSK